METQGQVIDIYVGMSWASVKSIFERAHLSCCAATNVDRNTATVYVSSEKLSIAELRKIQGHAILYDKGRFNFVVKDYAKET